MGSSSKEVKSKRSMKSKDDEEERDDPTWNPESDKLSTARKKKKQKTTSGEGDKKTVPYIIHGLTEQSCTRSDCFHIVFDVILSSSPMFP